LHQETRFLLRLVASCSRSSGSIECQPVGLTGHAGREGSTVKRLLPLVVIFSVAGCSGQQDQVRQKRSEQTESRVAALEQEFNLQIQKKLTAIESNYTARLEEVRIGSDQSDKEYRLAIGNLREKLDGEEKRIAVLEAALAAKPLLLPEQRTETKNDGSVPFSVYTPSQSDAIDFLVSPPPEDHFPVRVFDVQGKKVVTGSHVSSRFVETPDEYTDEMGNKTHVKQQEVTIDEYGYQAAFALQNLTRTVKKVSVEAGMSTKEFTLQPGETATNLAVDSAMGVGLRVSCGNALQRVPVMY